MDEFRLSAKDVEAVVDGEVIVPQGLPLVPLRANNGALQVQTRYTTAMAVPERRSLRVVEARLKEEAALLGEDAFYSWKAEGERSSGLVEGGTIDLAMVAARAWGNCVIEQMEVIETPEAWIFEAAFIDLETGYTTSRKFRQSRQFRVAGRFDEARKEQIRFEIGQSKAIRNVTLKAMPKWLINMAIGYAKGGVRQGIQRYVNEHGLEAARQIVVKRLASFQVSEAMILAKMERETVQGLTIEDLVLLQGDVKALEQGEETVGSLFGEAVQRPEAPTGETRTAETRRRVQSGRRTSGEGAYATGEQMQELIQLAATREGSSDLHAMIARSTDGRLTVAQYETSKAHLLAQPERERQPGEEG